MRTARRRRGVGRTVNVAFALVVSGLLLWVMAAGVGTIPPLGAVLDPGRGAWTAASGAGLPGAQTLHLTGLQHPVAVSFSAQGVPSIQAATDHDAYLALGYVQARFRLAEMDSERRLGEGRLAQLAGPSELGSDEFELRLGLLRTAQREWAATSRSSAAGQALLSFTQGVNDDIAQVRTAGNWRAEFSLARVYPSAWTPVDSLVIQGVLTQELDFTTTPLDYALLEKSLGPAKTMAWFPVNPANQQSPFDPGPYRNLGLTKVAPDAASSVPPVTAATTSSSSPQNIINSSSSSAVTAAAGQLLAQIGRLPAGLVHREPDSNAWAANGPVVAGHGAILAGDPHLPQTLPSIWYQAAISAPGLDVSGVTVPGVPGVLIGHNQHIAWSLTDTQNQGALFYAEQTSRSHPGQYYWRGAWRPMSTVHYTIPVRGGSARSLTVHITVHGPIMTQAGQTMAVDWMGNVPSPDLTALLGINQASNFAQFRAALASWHAPTQNFVYADDHGNIGEISAGYYPQVAHGDPWLPLSGTGADDIDGVIPYAAVPQVYDPPGHVIATANQRPVGSSYPYYIGTSGNFFDNSYRANQLYASLRGRSDLTPAAFAALQGNVTDNLAQSIVPKLVAALRQSQGQSGALTKNEQSALNQLASWNERDDDRLGRGLDLVDVLGRLHLGHVPALVEVGQGPDEQGPGRPGPVVLADQPDRGPRRLDDRHRFAAVGVRVHPPVGGESPDVAGDAAGVRHRRGPPGVEAGRIAVDLGLEQAAHPGVPVADRGVGAGVRAARLQRRRLDGGRGRGRPQFERRPVVADGDRLLRRIGFCWLFPVLLAARGAARRWPRASTPAARARTRPHPGTAT